jgi:succinate-acetate transporter protein
MPTENLKEKVLDLQDNLKNTVESSIAYYKLWLFKVLMKSTTLVVKLMLMLLFFFLLLFFSSIALALYLGQVCHSSALGFLMVGGMYLILCIIVYFLKDKILEGKILEKFSKEFFND